MLYEQFGADGNGTNVNEFPIFNEDNTEILFWLPAFTTPAVGATELVILQVNIQGDVNDMPLPAELNPPSNRLPPIETVSRNRTIEFKVEGQVSVNFAAQEGDTTKRDELMDEILSEIRGHDDSSLTVSDFTSSGGVDPTLALSFKAAKMVCPLFPVRQEFWIVLCIKRVSCQRWQGVLRTGHTSPA